MNPTRNRRTALCVLGAVLAVATVAVACDWWCVQGVIDWGTVPDAAYPPTIYGPKHTVHKVYGGHWDPEHNVREAPWDITAVRLRVSVSCIRTVLI